MPRPDEYLDRHQAAIDLELTTYFERAQAVQAERGVVSLTACLSADDLATLRSALAIVTFARTLGTVIGMPKGAAEELDATIGGLAQLAAGAEDARVNWSVGSGDPYEDAIHDAIALFDGSQDYTDTHAETRLQEMLERVQEAGR
jgi:hypothetical protein